MHLCTLYHAPSDEFSLIAGGISVCPLGFCIFFGISMYKYKEAVRHVRQQVAPVHGNHDRDYEAVLHDHVVAWFSNYSQEYGEHMPHLKYIYLPPGLLKSDIYDCYVRNTENLYSAASASTFHAVWRSEFPHVTIPKRITLRKCDKCCQYAKAKAEAKPA